jgi:predicted lipoprotein
MDVWQRAELLQFGPAAGSRLPGGQDLRDAIYSWTAISACRVDQNTEDGEFAEGLSSQVITTRGLDAIEYLLFTDSAANDCLASSSLNTGDPSSWSEIPEDELWQRRADYAKLAAEDVAAQAQLLVEAWLPDEGAFQSELAEAGLESAIYSSTQAAMDAFYGGLFYMDTMTKDTKLGRPIGAIECPGSLCEFESPFAFRNKAHVARNVESLRDMVMGCNESAYAFDDLLSELDVGGPAESLDAQLEDVLSAIDDVEEGTFNDALQEDPDSLSEIFLLLTNAMKTMKQEFAEAAQVELPSGGPTDAD